MCHRQLFRHLPGNPDCASLGQQQMLSNPWRNASWGSSESSCLCSGQGPRAGTGLWEPSLSLLWMLCGMPRPRMQRLPWPLHSKRELDRFLVRSSRKRPAHVLPLLLGQWLPVFRASASLFVQTGGSGLREERRAQLWLSETKTLTLGMGSRGNPGPTSWQILHQYSHLVSADIQSFHSHQTSPTAQQLKNLPAMQETWVQSHVGWEDPLEEETATHSSTPVCNLE